MTAVFGEGHSHAVLPLSLPLHHRLSVLGALRLRNFLVVAAPNALTGIANVLRMHEIAKALVVILLQVVGLVADQRQVVVVVARVLHAELAVRVHVPVDHLWVVIIPLRLYLVPHVLLENVRCLPRLILDRGHHIRARGQVRIIARFE